jgi:hypothetical protein
LEDDHKCDEVIVWNSPGLSKNRHHLEGLMKTTKIGKTNSKAAWDSL